MSGHPRKTIGPEGGSEVLRLALEAARRDGPDRAQLARLAARLPLHLPGGPGGGGATGGPADGGATGSGAGAASGGGAGTAAGGGAGTAAGGGAGAASGGGAGAQATGGGAGVPATHAPAGIASTGAVAPPSVLSGLGIGAALGVVLVGAVWLMPSHSQPPPPAPLAPSGAAVVATATPAEAAAATPEAPAEASAAAEPPRAPAPEPPRAPAGAPLPARASASAAGAPAAGASAPAALPDAETEIGLLQRAQEALAARPAEALALADAHLARFPGGALAQEREVIAVGALTGLGRDEAALARAHRFVAAHPSSAYRRRLEILVPELRHAQP